jgi:polyferredoxin
MQTARRISQIIFLVLFLLIFFMAIDPLASKIPVDFFLRLDPLVAVSSSLSARSILVHSLPAFIVIFITLFIGRFFCGWICPLGTTVDGCDHLTKAKYQNESFRRSKWLKFGLLVVVLIASLVSIQLAGFVSPIPLYTRSLTTFLYPLFALTTDSFLGLFMSISFMENVVFQINEFLRGTVLPIHAMVFRGSIIIALFYIGILILAVFHRRFWCRNLCPAGALLALFSKWRWYRREVTDECTSCGLCRKTCRMDAIQEDFKSTNHLECISCMDCQKICPVNAVNFRFGVKPSTTKIIDFSKRRFIRSGAVGLLSVGILKIGFTDQKKKGYAIRPPGSLEEDPFLDRCVRCGECVRVCSSMGAGLQLAGLETGWTGVWTPVLMPKTGYCEYNCNLCGQVCPTGAIHPLSVEEKQDMKMGTAHFDKTRCIPWYYGENCMVCEEHCPLSPKAIQFHEAKVTTINGEEATVLLPYVDEEKCTGCGICVNRCPVEGDRGIFLTNADEVRWTD